jgi:hypothetical protein
VHEPRTLEGAYTLQRIDKLIQIVSIDGAEVPESKFLEQHAGCKEALHGLFPLSHELAYALQLAVLGGDRNLPNVPASAFPPLKRVGEAVSLYVMALLVINLVSVILQCGLGQCHTFGYALLHG